MFNKYRLHIFFLIAGSIAGYLVFHPYTMLVFSIMRIYHGGEVHFHVKDPLGSVLTAFEPMMLPMSIAFAFFGGFVGLLIGIIVDRKKKIYDKEHESEKKEVALETLKRLMVTLSHYLLNISMIIGGEVRLSQKAVSEKETLISLEVIAKQAKKIDAVIGALKKVTEIKTTDYTTKGCNLMLDITEEMEKLLKETKGEQG